MKKLILIGKSGSGKTTLTRRLKNLPDEYHKTQYIDYGDFIIDTPGEYAQTHHLGRALALYSYEADIVGLLISSTEEYSLFPPCITCLVNREVIGIVTKAEEEGGNPDRAENWLRLSGCKKVFRIDSVTGYGVNELIEYLNQ